MCVGSISVFSLMKLTQVYVSLYVRKYAFFTSLCTGKFNRVWWLQAMWDLPVDIPTVRKLGMDYFLRNIEKGSRKIKSGVV